MQQLDIQNFLLSMTASVSDDLCTLQRLINTDRSLMTAVDDNGRTLLFYAVFVDAVRIVDWLIM
jgi:hypothetical protein